MLNDVGFGEVQALEKSVETGGKLDTYEIEGPDRPELLQDIAEFNLALVSSAESSLQRSLDRQNFCRDADCAHTCLFTGCFILPRLRRLGPDMKIPGWEGQE